MNIVLIPNHYLNISILFDVLRPINFYKYERSTYHFEFCCSLGIEYFYVLCSIASENWSLWHICIKSFSDPGYYQLWFKRKYFASICRMVSTALEGTAFIGRMQISSLGNRFPQTPNQTHTHTHTHKQKKNPNMQKKINKKRGVIIKTRRGQIDR